MRILVMMFIVAAVFVGVQVVWFVFIRNHDKYTTAEQDAITRQTLALVFILMLVQFRQGYTGATTLGHLWALFLFDAMWCGVAIFAGWNAVQYRVFVLVDLLRANFRQLNWASPGPIAVWCGYGVMAGSFGVLVYFWLMLQTQLNYLS